MSLLQQQERKHQPPPQQGQVSNDNEDGANDSNTKIVSNHNIDDANEDDDTFSEQHHCFDPCHAYNNNSIHSSNIGSTNNTSSSNGACIAAFQATVDCSVDQFQNTMSCGHGSLHFFQHSSSNMGKFHPANYFKRNTHQHRVGSENSSSEDYNNENNSKHSYLYSSSSPVGPTKCEYCGNDNADECVSNLPKEYYDRMLSLTVNAKKGNQRDNNYTDYKQSSRRPTRSSRIDNHHRNGNGIIVLEGQEDGNDNDNNNANNNHYYLPAKLTSTVKTIETTATTTKASTSSTSTKTSLSTSPTPPTSNTTSQTTTTTTTTTIATPMLCPRPKLFFLKKRPPFAQQDGWNPRTEYRMNLFEPPSSLEGMGLGKKEVRGHLGSLQQQQYDE